MRHTVLFLLPFLSACGVSTTGNNSNKVGLGGDREDCPSGIVSSSELSEKTRDASAALGIAVGMANNTCQHPGVDCEPIQPEQGKLAELFIASLKSELGRYPTAFLRDHGPKQIWFVDDLKMEGVKWEAGGVTFADRTIYLNVMSACSSAGRSLTIQHEFFHVLDGQLFVNNAWNQAWTNLNPAGFRYDTDYNHVEGYDLHSEEGFATSYATTNMMEDRAETYTYAVTRAAVPLLQKWMKSDEYLHKKEASMLYWLGYQWPELSSFLSDYAR